MRHVILLGYGAKMQSSCAKSALSRSRPGPSTQRRHVREQQGVKVRAMAEPWSESRRSSTNCSLYKPLFYKIYLTKHEKEFLLEAGAHLACFIHIHLLVGSENSLNIYGTLAERNQRQWASSFSAQVLGDACSVYLSLHVTTRGRIRKQQKTIPLKWTGFWCAIINSSSRAWVF